MSSNLKGVLWALSATALFGVAAALTKLASRDFPVLQILFFRQMIMLASVAPVIMQDFPNNLKSRRVGLHAFRLMGAFTALVGGFWAVAVLPLTTATVLAFSSVFFTTLLATGMLGERIGLARISAILVGFAGVIVVMRPSMTGLADPRSLIAIVGAMGVAVAMVSVRKLSSSESNATLIAYQGLFVGLLAALPMPWIWVAPDASGLVLLLAIGVLSAIGQWSGVRSLRAGEAGLIASVEYMKLIYATLLGYWLFSEWPDAFTLAGAALIIGSALFTVHREARRARIGSVRQDR